MHADSPLLAAGHFAQPRDDIIQLFVVVAKQADWWTPYGETTVESGRNMTKTGRRPDNLNSSENE